MKLFIKILLFDLSALVVNIKVTSAFITFANIQGATYGLIAGSLNHIAHEIVHKYQIDVELKDAGIKGSDVPEMDMESLKKVETMKSISALSKATNPKYNIIQKKSNAFGSINDNNWEVELYAQAFSSYRILASTIFHELTHLSHFVNPQYYRKWANSRLDPSKATLRNYSEFLAHSAELKYSGLGNPELYDKLDIQSLKRLFGNGN